MRGTRTPWVSTLGAPTAVSTGILISVLTWSGCGEEASADATAVSDSAGIEVTTNSSRALAEAPRWTLSPTPVVEIGSGADPDIALFQVVAVVPLEARRVAIGMRAPPQALIVEPDGSLVARLGRRGDGPGEFIGVGSLVPLGSDSIAVWDPERQRLAVFTVDGSHQREVDLRNLAPPSPLTVGNVYSLAARTYLFPSEPGTLVLFSVGVFGTGPEQGIYRVRAPSYLISTVGERLEVVGSFPGEATYVDQNGGLAPFVLGEDTYGTMSGSSFVVGTSDAPEFRMYSATGTLERIVRWADHERTLGGVLLDHWIEYVDTHVESLPEAERSGRRELIEAIPDPERLPAYGNIIGSDTGEIWVGPYHPGQLPLLAAYAGRSRIPAQQWLVFDPGGMLIATVETPDGFRPYAVKERWLWGVATDDLDVESVRAFAIETP